MLPRLKIDLSKDLSCRWNVGFDVDELLSYYLVDMGLDSALQDVVTDIIPGENLQQYLGELKGMAANISLPFRNYSESTYIMILLR